MQLDDRVVCHRFGCGQRADEFFGNPSEVAQRGVPLERRQTVREKPPARGDSRSDQLHETLVPPVLVGSVAVVHRRNRFDVHLAVRKCSTPIDPASVVLRLVLDLDRAAQLQEATDEHLEQRALGLAGAHGAQDRPRSWLGELCESGVIEGAGFHGTDPR